MTSRKEHKPTRTRLDTESVDSDYPYNTHPAPRWNPFPPRNRRDFEVAIICALPLEASVVGACFGRQWDDQTYGKAPSDSNAYSTGVIATDRIPQCCFGAHAKHGNGCYSDHSSLPSCQLSRDPTCSGGRYLRRHTLREAAEQFPNNTFVRKDTPRDNLPRPGPNLRAALAKLQAEQGRRWLENKTSENLGILRQRLSDVVKYLGTTEDRLFKSTYRHKHHNPLECAICANNDGRDGVCDKAIETSCQQLKCDEWELVLRGRSIQSSNPIINFGLVASGDTVMKSGEDRDDIAARDGVCDYADSHKNERWQGYAAATAAAVTKGFLENWGTGITHPPTPLSLGVGTGELDPARRAKELEILRRLHKSPYRDRKERNPDRIPGTCEWFVAHELFRDWQESKSSKMLWVSADPGYGKSVLAKYLIDSALATTESRTTCYFFFKDDFEDQRSIVCALCCVLRQLFLQKRMLLSEKIFEQFEMDGERFTSSFNELWDAIISAAEDKNAGEIICLFDAIDECEDRGRSQLTQALCKLGRASI
ncbi:hypothetical protein V8E54_013705 [Elaphomyces granulatus]